MQAGSPSIEMSPAQISMVVPVYNVLRLLVLFNVDFFSSHYACISPCCNLVLVPRAYRQKLDVSRKEKGTRRTRSANYARDLR